MTPRERAAEWSRRTRERVEASPNYRRWVLISVLVGVGATSFPISVFGASLPTIAEDLGTSESVITWVITAPILGFAIAMPILGKLGDLVGHRRVYLVGFAAATVLAALTATAWNAPSLIVFRVFGQTVGAATGPASMALIMTAFPKEERVRAIGWWSLVVAGAPMLGLVVGGPVIDAIGWRVLFLAQAVPAAVAVLVAIPVLPETPRKEGISFDMAGAAALAGGVGAFLVALNRAPHWGWNHGAVMAGLAVAPLALGLFVWIERRAAHPLIPLDWFGERNFAAPIVIALFMQGSYMGAFILAPFLLTKEFGYSATAITLIMTFRPLAFSTAGPIAGSMSIRFGERAVAVFGTFLVALSMPVMAFSALAHSIPLVALGLVLSGAGNGVSRPPLTGSIANAVDESDLGIATASQNIVGQLGAAIGITVLTVVQGERSTAESFAAAYWVGAAMAAVAVGLATLIRSTDRSKTADEVVGYETLGEETAETAPALARP